MKTHFKILLAALMLTISSTAYCGGGPAKVPGGTGGAKQIGIKNPSKKEAPKTFYYRWILSKLS